MRWASVQAIDVKFSQDLTHQKSLKSVNFWQSYLKIKKVDVFLGHSVCTAARHTVLHTTPMHVCPFYTLPASLTFCISISLYHARAAPCFYTDANSRVYLWCNPQKIASAWWPDRWRHTLFLRHVDVMEIFWHAHFVHWPRISIYW